MAENSTVGPADDNDTDGFTVIAHETLGHLDDTVGGSDENQTISLSESGDIQPLQYPY